MKSKNHIDSGSLNAVLNKINISIEIVKCHVIGTKLKLFR